MYTSFATQNSARNRNYIVIDIYTYYTVTHWTQQHSHNHHHYHNHNPRTSIYIYIFIHIHLYYINLYYISTNTRGNSSHSLLCNYHTGYTCCRSIYVGRLYVCLELSFASQILCPRGTHRRSRRFSSYREFVSSSAWLSRCLSHWWADAFSSSDNTLVQISEQ